VTADDPVLAFALGVRARVDWWQVITDLERCQVSHPQIAAAVGRAWGWPNYLKDSPGAEPRFADGVVLVQLWVAHTRRPVGEIPLERRPGPADRRRAPRMSGNPDRRR